MLIGITGTLSSGKTEVVRYLTFSGFKVLQLVEGGEEKEDVEEKEEVDKKVENNLSNEVDDLVKGLRERLNVADGVSVVTKIVENSGVKMPIIGGIKAENKNVVGGVSRGNDTPIVEDSFSKKKQTVGSSESGGSIQIDGITGTKSDSAKSNSANSAPGLSTSDAPLVSKTASVPSAAAAFTFAAANSVPYPRATSPSPYTPGILGTLTISSNDTKKTLIVTEFNRSKFPRPTKVKTTYVANKEDQILSIDVDYDESLPFSFKLDRRTSAPSFSNSIPDSLKSSNYLKRTSFVNTRTKQNKKPVKSTDDPVADLVFHDLASLINYVTLNWREHFVISHISDLSMLNQLSKRPFFLHLSVDAPTTLRYKRYLVKHAQSFISFESFVLQSDELLYNAENPLIKINNLANIKIINTSDNLQKLYVQLSKLCLPDASRLRPNWDSYFMRIADLAALRSNCMKRRVGCVITKENRIIATGYNGTPRNLPNCNEGGCPRCNSADGSGSNLSTCLCLHAEENALLESGRERAGGGILYCNTCPCLTCSIKIVQAGIKEVIYSQSYSMDDQSEKVLKGAGVNLRQFVPAKDGVFV